MHRPHSWALCALLRWSCATRYQSLPFSSHPPLPPSLPPFLTSHQGITVNAVLPGNITTEGAQRVSRHNLLLARETSCSSHHSAESFLNKRGAGLAAMGAEYIASTQACIPQVCGSVALRCIVFACNQMPSMSCSTAWEVLMILVRSPPHNTVSMMTAPCVALHVNL